MKRINIMELVSLLNLFNITHDTWQNSNFMPYVVQFNKSDNIEYIIDEDDNIYQLDTNKFMALYQHGIRKKITVYIFGLELSNFYNINFTCYINNINYTNILCIDGANFSKEFVNDVEKYGNNIYINLNKTFNYNGQKIFKCVTSQYSDMVIKKIENKANTEHDKVTCNHNQ